MSEALESLLRLRPEGTAGWFGSLRDEALGHFAEQGLPTRRLEDWKGTNFAPLGAMEFTRVGPDPTAAVVETPNAAKGPELVFVDGRFDAAASNLSDLPAGIRALSLADVLASEPDLLKGRLGRLPDLKRETLVALQTAFLEDGAVLVIEAGARTTRPLRTRFVSTPDSTAAADAASASFPRLLVIAGEESAATLLQEHVCRGVARGFTAFVAEFHLAPGAQVESVQVQAEGAERIHFTSVHAHLEQNARFLSHVFTLGTGLVRSELAIQLAESGAESKLCGLFVGREDGHIDHFTTVDHAAEQCTSDEEYRGVLGDRSKGVFRGRVIVRPGAQKTDARQSNPNLLLSEEATINTKPQLEIYADDIRASHGSTIGQLDPDALFFLRARGISAANARLLLTSAFAQAIVDRIVDDELRNAVATHVDAGLASLERSSLDSSRPTERGPNP